MSLQISWLVYLCLAVPSLIAQTATVEGIVETEDGRLIADAKVVLDPQAAGEYMMSGSTTNKNGEFWLDRVSPGEYAIYAEKDEEGFGDVGALLYGLQFDYLPNCHLVLLNSLTHSSEGLNVAGSY